MRKAAAVLVKRALFLMRMAFFAGIMVENQKLRKRKHVCNNKD